MGRMGVSSAFFKWMGGFMHRRGFYCVERTERGVVRESRRQNWGSTALHKRMGGRVH